MRENVDSDGVLVWDPAGLLNEGRFEHCVITPPLQHTLLFS